MKLGDSSPNFFFLSLPSTTASGVSVRPECFRLVVLSELRRSGATEEESKHPEHVFSAMQRQGVLFHAVCPKAVFPQRNDGCLGRTTARRVVFLLRVPAVIQSTFPYCAAESIPQTSQISTEAQDSESGSVFGMACGEGMKIFCRSGSFPSLTLAASHSLAHSLRGNKVAEKLVY